MIRTFTLDCTTETTQRIYSNWAVYLHGYLMEALPAQIAASMHDSEVRSFSQYIIPRRGGFAWTVSSWDDALSEALSELLKPDTRVLLAQKNVEFSIRSREESTATEQELFARNFLSEDVPRQYELTFATPCTHKRDGAYVLFPSADLIINSVYGRFSKFSGSLSLDDENVQAECVRSVRITNYSLRSALYHVEGARIPGYVGSVTLSLNTNQQLARLIGMVLMFAPYCGVGVKTALGMGACACRAKPFAGGFRTASDLPGSRQ